MYDCLFSNNISRSPDYGGVILLQIKRDARTKLKSLDFIQDQQVFVLCEVSSMHNTWPRQDTLDFVTSKGSENSPSFCTRAHVKLPHHCYESGWTAKLGHDFPVHHD